LGLMKKSIPPAMTAIYEESNECLKLATSEIRNLSHQLAPAIFEDSTLEDSFKTLLHTFNMENKYVVALNFSKDAKYFPISREIQLNLYRILQEQLSNISKHANATRIEISVSLNNGILQMRIADNGIGFNTEEKRSGIGLANIIRRTEVLSGKFSINSSIGNGCEIAVRIPLTKKN